MEYDYDGYDGDLQRNGEYFYDDSSLEEDDQVLEYATMNLEHMIYACMKPTLLQTANSLSFILIWALVFRISVFVIHLPRWLQHLLSALCGILALHSLFPTTFLLLTILPVLAYALLLVLHSHRGPSIMLLSLAYLLICELLWLDPRIWHQIRGPHMIIIMKIVSLAFDLDIGTISKVPNFIQFSGYMFCPGNCSFGPWTSYQDYVNIYEVGGWRPPWYKPYWLLQMLYSCLLSIVFLLLSTCVTHFALPESPNKWIAAYRDALSFRCSHYFVSYFSEVTLILCGYTKICFNSDIAVSKPTQIEVPRSLIQVVVSWNLPMHCWLKVYVFNTARRMGNLFAIMFTYAVSALLHGINFQLAAVLMSLGLYSYVEFMLRKKLASIFSACIQARSCKEECCHELRWKHPAVLCANIGFSLLAIMHLAYLGVMFDHTDISESGYSYQHTLSKWSDLNFFSHWLAISTYIVYFFI